MYILDKKYIKFHIIFSSFIIIFQTISSAEFVQYSQIVYIKSITQ